MQEGNNENKYINFFDKFDKQRFVEGVYKLRSELKGYGFSNPPLIPMLITKTEKGFEKTTTVSWAKWQERGQTDEEFNALPWSNFNGVAVILGIKNKDGYYLSAIDYDTHGAEILDVSILNDLVTWKEQTVSNGYHLIFLSREKPINRKYKNIELLGVNKLCILAPSYGYKRLNDNPPTIKEDINTLFMEKFGVEIKPEINQLNLVPDETLEKLLDFLKPEDKFNFLIERKEGDRNNYTYMLSCLLLNKYHCDPNFAWQIVLKYNFEKNKPPLDLKELKIIFDSAKKRGHVYGDWRFDERAKELMNEITFDDVAEVLDLVIKGDDAVKKIVFACMLLAYTEEDQQTVIMTGESSLGKSWIATHIADLFPKEDVVELAYSSPTAFFHEKGEWDEVNKVNRINLERKILLWLDMPHAETLTRLRPLLSHDRKEIVYKATDKKETKGMKTKTSVVKGFFSTVFCSSNAVLDQQERTRAFLLTPSDSQDKIQAAIELIAKYDKDPAEFKKDLENNPRWLWLKKRIELIKAKHVRYIKIPNIEDMLEDWFERHKVLKPREQRDFKRINALIKANALLNCFNREMTEEGDLIANYDDIEEGLRVYDAIAESNELGLPPYIYELYKDVLIPLIEELNDGVTIEDITKKYFSVKHRRIDRRLLDAALITLEAENLIYKDKSQKPYKYVLLKTFKDDEEDKSEDDGLNEFLNNALEINQEFWIEKEELYNSYKKFCELKGWKPKNKIVFGRFLTNKGFKIFRPRLEDKRVWAWKGLKFKENITCFPMEIEVGPRFSNIFFKDGGVKVYPTGHEKNVEESWTKAQNKLISLKEAKNEAFSILDQKTNFMPQTINIEDLPVDLQEKFKKVFGEIEEVTPEVIEKIPPDLMEAIEKKRDELLKRIIEIDAEIEEYLKQKTQKLTNSCQYPSLALQVNTSVFPQDMLKNPQKTTLNYPWEKQNQTQLNLTASPLSQTADTQLTQKPNQSESLLPKKAELTVSTPKPLILQPNQEYKGDLPKDGVKCAKCNSLFFSLNDFRWHICDIREKEEKRRYIV